MSGAAALIDKLAQSGVKLSRMGDRLVVDGPEAAVTDTLIEKVRALKLDLLRSLSDWSSDDWQAFFDERARIAEFDGGLTRADAETRAFECCVVEWLNRHPQRSDPGVCAWCDKPDQDGHVIVPFGTDSVGHIWLHPECWHGWHRKRRLNAVAALLALGIAAPSSRRRQNQIERSNS